MHGGNCTGLFNCECCAVHSRARPWPHANLATETAAPVWTLHPDIVPEPSKVLEAARQGMYPSIVTPLAMPKAKQDSQKAGCNRRLYLKPQGKSVHILQMEREVVRLLAMSISTTLGGSVSLVWSGRQPVLL